MATRGHLLLIAALAAVVLAACGDDEQIPPLTTHATDPSPNGGASPGSGAETEPAAQDKPSGPAESGDDDPRPTLLELEAAARRTVREFVAALDARDGERACALLAPGAIGQLELPEPRGSCVASLSASIGYRDPRGLPVWEGAKVARISSPEINGDTARVIATVLTTFADRDEVSVEDDVIYLSRQGAGWLISQPSSTLYRAVGIADVPPSVLSPP